MSIKAKKVDTPPDPDPAPVVSTAADTEVQGAARNERKRIARSYGRNQTILAGSNSQDNNAKKTILGG